LERHLKRSREVKHFAMEQWLDFARGLVAKQDREAMEQHLSSGCAKCTEAVDRLRRIVAATAADAAYVVPDYAVRSARAYFALQQPQKSSLLSRMVANLVFDSLREPALAGVRSQHKITRQAMYEAGDYCVDLRLERERNSVSVALVGQIANRVRPEQRIARVPVFLMSRKEVVGRTVSNGSGEFQMQYQPSKSLYLRIPVQEAGKQIEVPLKELFDPGNK
jgi:hypothetical protein